MTSPLLAFLHELEAAFDGHSDTPTWGLTAAELAEAQQVAHRVVNRASHTELKLAHQSRVDNRDAKTAWVCRTRQTPRVCASRLKLAKAVDGREPLREAMAAGQVSEPQAREVVRALQQLPDDLPAEIHADAETELIKLCASLHADELRRAGDHILALVAPEVAEAEEAKRVEKEYRNATAKRRLGLWDRGDGSYAIKGVLPAFHAHALSKLLQAYMAPKHQHAGNAGDTGDAGVDDADLVDGVRPDLEQRRGHAFCEFLERLNPDSIPNVGGVSARVVVTMDLDALTTKLKDAGVVTVDGVVDIPAWEARRMACEADLIPSVLSSKSEPLDLGRKKRFHTPAQRTAIHLRDVTCRAEGCDWPAWMGHIHHPEPWSRGGRTDLGGMSLCPSHHARAHDPHYRMTTASTGKVTFHQRT